MRKVIDRYVDGVFDYDPGKLSFSVPRIEATLPSLEESSGSFRIFSSDSSDFEADVYSSNMRLSIKNSHISGNDVTVLYSVNPQGLENGHEIIGDIQVVSDRGEYFLSYKFEFRRGHVKTSLGNIKNLFHFTNQAQTDWEEAVSLFYSDQFLRVFDGNDRIYYNIYRGFSNVIGNNQAVEDFLVAINKKKPMTYSIDRTSYEFNDISEELRCEVKLYKSTWGYVDVAVDTDSMFLRLEKNRVTSSDFLGNTYKLVFYILNDNMHEGRNYGNIIIRSKGQKLTISIVARHRARVNSLRIERREKKNLTAKLMRSYIDFRMKKINVGSWVKDSMRIVERMNALDEKNPISRLYQSQLLLVQKRENEANWILDHVENEMNITGYSDEAYAYFLYLKSLSVRDSHYVDEIAEKIASLFAKNPNSFEILWTLLYLDEDMAQNTHKKIDEINKLFEKGCTSPILYVEAYNYYSCNPDKLTSIGPLEQQVLLFSLKCGVMDLEIKKQVVYLASKARGFSKLLYKVLDGIYELSLDFEIVEVVTSMLIKGAVTGEKYFKWFDKAVELQLRIINLYENYLYCLPEDYTDPIPRAVLMYFNFQNDMDEDRIARLYANLVMNKNVVPESYEAYRENIQVFAVEQISKCAINKNLAIIYNDILFPEMVNPEMAQNLSSLLFAHEVFIDKKHAKEVVLIQSQFREQQHFPVVNKYAYPFITSDDYALFYEDEYRRRTLIDNSASRKVINETTFIPVIKNYVTDNVYFSMYLCEGRRHYVVVDEDNVDFCRELTDSSLVREEAKRDIRMSLIQYYYDNDQITTLDEYISSMDISILNSKDRAEVIKFYVRRGMYEEAYEIITRYGVEDVSPKVCVRICNHVITINDALPDDMLIRVCYYAFERGKYDEVTLNYLVQHFNGLTKEMRNIWKAAKEFELDCRQLMERLLIQILYAHTTVGEKEEIFEMYLKAGASTKVEIAYLSYSAYEYFTKDRITDESVFEHIVKNYKYDEPLNDACKLGILKYYAEEEKNYKSDVREMIITFVLEFLRRNIYFRFFNEFSTLVPELSDYMDKTVIEYRTSPNNRVTLHYVFESPEKVQSVYKTEEMRNMYGGVYSREFIIFFGERLQYYITEDSGGKEMLTASDSISLSDTAIENNESRYSILNDMVVSRMVQDDSTLLKLMGEYVDADAFVEKMFSMK